MNTSANFHTPSAPSMFKEGNSTRYPELLSDSTNFRIKKIIDDEKMLQDEIKHRDSVCKKYGRYSSLTDGVEYTLILVDIGLGTLATAIPGVGNVVSSATFSGVGLISGVAKLIRNKLNIKIMKHYRLSVIASTTLNNLRSKISKAIIDEQITHEEFEDIQNTMNEWKNGSKGVTKQQLTMSPETIELLSQQATEKAQKELLDQLKHINLKNLKK